MIEITEGPEVHFTPEDKPDCVQAIAATRRQYKELADGTLRASFDIDPKYKSDFLRLFPEIDMPAGIVPLKSNFQATKNYGQQAKALKQSSFLRTPDVWRALGSDDEYLAWLRKLPCAACQSEVNVVAAHVRRVADGAGIGIKPEYSAIPLCNAHHMAQHQYGESAIGGKEWCDRKRIEYVSEWAWAQLKATLGYESMADVPPVQVFAWAVENGLMIYLPAEYCDG